MKRYEYQQIEPDFYTCVPVPGFEKDPAVTKAIREFDPELIPMWRLQVWRFPDGSVRRIVHHVIGRYFPVPRHMRRHFHVGMPMDARRPAPNFLDAILEFDDTLQFKRGGPGDYVPWDWALYRWCRSMYESLTVETWRRRHEAKEIRLAREKANVEAEMEYRKRQIEPYLERVAGTISDAEWKQYLQAVWGAPGSPELRRKPKPMVIVGGRSPRSTKPHERVAPAQGEANGSQVLE